MKKRFYDTAACAKVDGGYAVQLDGRGIKTPQGTPLLMPTQALAEAIADEWNAQGEEIDPKTMEMMPMAGTAIDRVPEVRDGLIEGLLKYAETDLLCYRAERPKDLIQRQKEAWDPVLDWAAKDLGARLKPTHGIVAIDQDPEALSALKKVLEGFDNWTLTAMGELVGISGSLVVGLALIKGHLTVEQALHICEIDEAHQNEQWGEDFEAIERRKNIAKDVTSAHRFFKLASV